MHNGFTGFFGIANKENLTLFCYWKYPQKAIDLCKNVGDIGEMAKKLVKFAIDNGSRDNTSVMILSFNWSDLSKEKSWGEVFKSKGACSALRVVQ